MLEYVALTFPFKPFRRLSKFWFCLRWYLSDSIHRGTATCTGSHLHIQIPAAFKRKTSYMFIFKDLVPSLKVVSGCKFPASIFIKLNLMPISNIRPRKNNSPVQHRFHGESCRLCDLTWMENAALSLLYLV